MSKFGIASMGYYLPQTKKKVTEVFRDEEIPLGSLSKRVDFVRDIGIDTVHVTDEMPSELAVKAANIALEKAQLLPEEVDLVIDFTSIAGDYVGPIWSAAGLLQKRLGLKNAFATGVTVGGCAAYHVALEAALSLMKSDENINVALLAAGDRTPRYNKAYYPITVASDGGCAFVVRKGETRREILVVETISMGRLHDVWYVPGFPISRPKNPVSEKNLHMYCDMKRFNEGVIPVNLIMFKKIIERVLERTGLAFENIDYFVYPTFSTWDQKNFIDAFKISTDKIYLKNLRCQGHVQESDMVINYMDAVRDGCIKPGDIVMVISNGAGFAWSAAIIRD